MLSSSKSKILLLPTFSLIQVTLLKEIGYYITQRDQIREKIPQRQRKKSSLYWKKVILASLEGPKIFSSSKRMTQRSEGMKNFGTIFSYKTDFFSDQTVSFLFKCETRKKIIFQYMQSFSRLLWSWVANLHLTKYIVFFCLSLCKKYQKKPEYF